MKVAVLYPGMPRVNQERLHNHRQHLLDRYDCDVYISTYDNNDIDRQKERGGGECQALAQGTEQDFIKYYNPFALEVESEKVLKQMVMEPLWQLLGSKGVTCPNGIPPLIGLMQLYKIYRCYAMILEAGRNYDVVIRTRFDTLFETTVPLVVNDCLNIPYGADWCGGIYDHLAFGNMSVMRAYCGLYETLQKHPDKFPVLHGEQMVRWNAQLHGLQVKRFGLRVFLRSMDWWFNHWAELPSFETLDDDAQRGIVKDFKLIVAGKGTFYYSGPLGADRRDVSNYTTNAPHPLPWPVH